MVSRDERMIMESTSHLANENLMPNPNLLLICLNNQTNIETTELRSNLIFIKISLNNATKGNRSSPSSSITQMYLFKEFFRNVGKKGLKTWRHSCLHSVCAKEDWRVVVIVYNIWYSFHAHLSFTHLWIGSQEIQ